MSKLTGLLVFVAVLAGAIALTRYYSAPESPAAPERPALPAQPPVPPPLPGTEETNAAVTFRPKQVTLDFATGRGHAQVELERDPARPAPERVWVWTYFFAGDASGERRYCAGDVVQINQPFASGNRTTVNVTSSPSCPAPSNASATYYARISVSAESAFAARLSERQISYDITRATPVVVEGARARSR